ncbi:hypothetical protein OAS39_09720 [Pirellulales bacterium]|nr:hypothetical protein [Pirellulales bacterium]
MIARNPSRRAAEIGRSATRWSLLVLAAFAPMTARAAESYFVSDQQAGVIWRLNDDNADGDALDVGERLLWGDGLSVIAELDHYNGSIFAVEEGLSDGLNRVVRFTDVNGDGDALDVGERTIWADGFDDPRGIAVDSQGNAFVVEFEDGFVWSLSDINGDGDALDIGERLLYAEGDFGETSIAIQGDHLLVTSAFADQVFRLVDGNADGDALDVGERIAITSSIDFNIGLLDDGGGGFFVSSFSGDAVYHAVDRNGDGDMLDVAETLSYADSVFGALDGPWGLEMHEQGGFLIAEYSDGQVSWARDANRDGDALDVGDVHLFAEGIGLPVDIVAVPECSPDADEDGDVDGRDFLILQRENPEKIPLWETAYGTDASLAAAAQPVPEPAALVLAALCGGILRLPPFCRTRQSFTFPKLPKRRQT